MKNTKPSDTFAKLYNYIILDLIYQIHDKNSNYVAQEHIGIDTLPVAIWKNYEKYLSMTTEKMASHRLDRHKLASCICGAIIETRPLTGLHNTEIPKNVNEVLAFMVGINVVKLFMIRDFVNKPDIPSQNKISVQDYLIKNFEMQFPSNICDNQEYVYNMVNALYWSHFECVIKQEECFPYDIWAYSKIFYHLELFNQIYCEQLIQQYVNNSK